MLKPVLPAALPAASGWPWLWAIGATGVISLLVGLRPYRLLLATLPLRVLRQDVVANVWPLKTGSLWSARWWWACWPG
jgi:putative ABC transport system permease protein